MTCVLARLSTIRDPPLDARAQAGVSKLVISAADLALATDFSTKVKFGKNNYRPYFRISYFEFRWNHSNTDVSSHSCEVLIVIFIFVSPGFIVCRGIEGIVWFNAGASTRKRLPEKGHLFDPRGNRLTQKRTQRGNRLTQKGTQRGNRLTQKGTQRGNRLSNRLSQEGTQRGNRLTQNSNGFIERGCFCIDVSPQERVEVKWCSSFSSSQRSWNFQSRHPLNPMANEINRDFHRAGLTRAGEPLARSLFSSHLLA